MKVRQRLVDAILVALLLLCVGHTALRLYESFGFAIEGTMTAYVVGADGYIDAHKMGRVRI